MDNEKAIKLYSGEGLEIYQIAFSKFKTNTITVYFHDDLSKETVAQNALLPAVLKQGCRSYPTRKEISLRLQELYGAVLDGGVSKKGEMQLVYFYLETIQDAYANSGEKLSEAAFDILFELITKPVSQSGAFLKEYVELEKNNFKQYIDALINDKMSYAMERCTQEMCKDEAYGIYEYGSIADYDKIDEKNLYENYQRVISTLPISVYVTGQVEAEWVEKIKAAFAGLKRSAVKPVKPISFGKAPEVPHFVEEKLNVNQAKLVMGYRTHVDPRTDAYYALMVYNSILGGGMHSKLFQNVREKAGLAYYAFSRVERYKGILFISSGIEMTNGEKVRSIIAEQLEDLKQGNISDYEYEAALKTIKSSIQAIKDSQVGLTDFMLGQNLLGTNETLDSIIGKVKSVTKEDVKAVAHAVVADTVYFLTGQQGGEQHGN